MADNEFTNNPNSFETTHTEYTSEIYDIMKKKNMPIEPKFTEIFEPNKNGNIEANRINLKGKF